MRNEYKFNELSHAEYAHRERNKTFNLVFRKGDPVARRNLFGKLVKSKRKVYNEDMYGLTDIAKNKGIFYTKEETMKLFGLREWMFDENGYVVSCPKVTLWFINGEEAVEEFKTENAARGFWSGLSVYPIGFRRTFAFGHIE